MGSICIESYQLGIACRLEWMATEGSPGSRVEKIGLDKWEFSAVQDFKSFSIRF